MDTHPLIIEKLSDKLFIVNDVNTKSPIGRRMTIIVLPDNTLCLHSPILVTGLDKENVDKLGNVSIILVPNGWHTKDTEAVSNQYPSATVFFPKDLKHSLKSKIKKQAIYEDNWTPSLTEHLKLIPISGLKKPELVFYHIESKTLIVTDMFFNFESNKFTGLTKHLMAFNQADRFGTTRLFKWAIVKDKLAFSNSISTMTKTYEIEKIIVSHGDIIRENGGKKITDSLNQSGIP
jgi:hypothetical protein